MLKIALVAACLAPALAFAQAQKMAAPKTAPKPPPVGTKVSFTACPIFRPIEGGCWSAVNKGVTYNLNNASTKPMQGLIVRVEGTVSNNVHICPGVILNPLKLTVTKQSCLLPKAR
jgi:hypothetical protein